MVSHFGPQNQRWVISGVNKIYFCNPHASFARSSSSDADLASMDEFASNSRSSSVVAHNSDSSSSIISTLYPLSDFWEPEPLPNEPLGDIIGSVKPFHNSVTSSMTNQWIIWFLFDSCIFWTHLKPSMQMLQNPNNKTPIISWEIISWWIPPSVDGLISL